MMDKASMAPGMAEQVLQLRDIHLPSPPSWWPPAPGWWLLGLVLLTLLVLAGWRLARAWQRRRRWRALQAALREIEHGLNEAPGPEPLAALSALLKRIALERFPRAQVAPLSGTEWLAFLDRSGGGAAFTEGPGRVLAHGPYHASLDRIPDVPGLMRAVRHWVDQVYGGRA